MKFNVERVRAAGASKELAAAAKQIEVVPPKAPETERSAEHEIPEMGGVMAMLETTPEELQRLVDRAKERGFERFAGKQQLAAFREWAEGALKGVNPEEFTLHANALAEYVVGGGKLTDPGIQDNPALPIVRQVQRMRVMEEVVESAREISTVDDVAPLPTGAGSRHMRGVGRTAWKAAAASAGTVATAKGFYASLMALQQMAGLSASAATVYWASMGAAVGDMGVIVWSGTKLAKEVQKEMTKGDGVIRSARRALKSNPVPAIALGISSMTSALFATAFVLKTTATTERAGVFGTQVQAKVKPFEDIARGGAPAIPSVLAQVRQVHDRSLAIVAAEQNPALRGRGVGNTGTGSGYGPVAQSLEFFFTGHAREIAAGNQSQQRQQRGQPQQPQQPRQEVGVGVPTVSRDANSNLAKAEAVREKFGLRQGQAIEERYQEILDEYAKHEREETLRIVLEFTGFLNALKTKQPIEYAVESVDPRPPELDPNLITPKKEELKVALRRLAEKYAEGAQTVGQQFLTNFTKEGLVSLGLAQAGIEIPTTEITIDTSELDKIGNFSSSALPFPTGEEWKAVEQFRQEHGLPDALFSSESDAGRFKTYILILLTYLVLVDNLAYIMNINYDRQRQNRERRLLYGKKERGEGDGALAELHTQEEDIAERIALLINRSVLPAMAAEHGGTHQIVDADYVRYMLRREAFEQHPEQGMLAQVSDSLFMGAHEYVGKWIWGDVLPDTQTFNTYQAFLANVRKRMQTPEGLVTLAADLVPGSGQFLLNTFQSIGDPQAKELDEAELFEARLTTARSRAAFLKTRVGRTDRLLENIRASRGSGKSSPFTAEDRTLDGSGTFFFDDPEFRKGFALNSFGEQRRADIAEFDRLVSIGVASARELQDIQLRRGVAVAVSNRARQQAIQIGGTQFPEFLLGVAGTVSSDDVALLSPEQGVDAAMAVRLKQILEGKGGSRDASESLQFADTHSLAENRRSLAATFPNMNASVGIGYRSDSSGYGGFAVINRLLDPNDPDASAEVSYIYDPNSTPEQLNRSIERWASCSQPELEARFTNARLDSEARQLRSAISQTLPNTPLDASFDVPFSNAVEGGTLDSLARFLKIAQQVGYQSELLKETKAIFTEENMEAAGTHIDPELLEAFRKPVEQVSVGGLTTPEEVARVRGALSDAATRFGDTHAMNVLVREGRAYLAIRNRSTKKENSIPLENVGREIDRVISALAQ